GAGYGVVVGGSLAWQFHPIYGMLLATILITLFYALFSWRVHAERERYFGQLRPFVASQRLFEDLLTRAGAEPPEADVRTPFRALCGDVLGARVAYLVAVGPLSALVGPPWTYPEGAVLPPEPLADAVAGLSSPETMCVSVDPARYGGAAWAVPLWSERGLIGV